MIVYYKPLPQEILLLLLLLFSELPLLDRVLYNLGAYKKLRMAPLISLDGTFSCTECMSM